MKYIWFVIFTLSALTAFGQKSARVRQLEEQRKKALAEVEMTNQLLQETTQTAQNTLNRLNLLSQQILSRKKVISLLNQELGELDNQITASRREINKLEKELDGKRENYGKSMQSMYKRRSSQDKLLFILSADNFAQSMRRMRYLREYADWQKLQATEIIDKQTEITLKQKELEKTRSEKNALLGTREQESQKLQTEETSQKAEVQQLNKKQKQLKEELRKKQQQANALNRQIEKQIAEEIARAGQRVRTGRTRSRYQRRLCHDTRRKETVRRLRRQPWPPALPGSRTLYDRRNLRRTTASGTEIRTHQQQRYRHSDKSRSRSPCRLQWRSNPCIRSARLQ